MEGECPSSPGLWSTFAYQFVAKDIENGVLHAQLLQVVEKSSGKLNMQTGLEAWKIAKRRTLTFLSKRLLLSYSHSYVWNFGSVHKTHRESLFPCKLLRKQLRKPTSWDASLYVFSLNARDVSNFTETCVESHSC